jgi:hypothetical protein
MSSHGGSTVLAALAVALLTACSAEGGEPPAGSAAASQTPPPSSTAAMPSAVVLGGNGEIPRSLVVGTGGRVSVLLTRGSGGALVTVEDMAVVRTADLGSPAGLSDVVLARDETGDDLVSVVAAQAARDDDGTPLPGGTPVISLLAVSGSVVQDRPVDPPPPVGDQATLADASPDGRTVYVLTGGRGADLPNVLAVDPDTGGIGTGAVVDPEIAGLTGVTRTALTVADDGSLWIAVSGETSGPEADAAALVHLSAELAPLSVDPLPARSVDAVGLDGAAPVVALRSETADQWLIVTQPTSERGDDIPISSENLAASGIAVSAGDVAVTHEGVDGRPTVSIGRLGEDPRTTSLCPEDGDTWDVAAAPDGGFYVTGTCGDLPRLWLVR